jgi:hypothetical protein
LDLSAGTLVGYTESEIKEHCGDHIQAFKSKLNITDDDVLMNELRQRYNGYRFGLDTANGKISEPIYNPFAINHVFRLLQYSDKWTLSGSASMLSKKLVEQGYSYESMLTTSVMALEKSYKPSEMSLTSLMYFGGYATIDTYDKVTNELYLKIPNKSINTYLARDYLESIFSSSNITPFDRLAKKIHHVMTVTPINEMGSKIEEITNLLDSVLDYFTYDAMNDEAKFRNIMDTMLKMGFHNVAQEIHTKNGRIDTVITEKSRVIIIEYKHYKKSSGALKQIFEKEYYAHYLSKNLPILLFGISLKKNDESTTKYIEISYDIINIK